MLRVMRASRAAKTIILYLSLMNTLCALLIAFLSEINYLSLSSLIFCFFAITINFVRAYQKSPFSLLMSFFITLYLVIPLTFVSVSGVEYQYGIGLGFIPENNNFYSEAAPFAIVFMILCLIAMVIGLIVGNRMEQASDYISLSRSKKVSIWVVGLLVVFFTYLSNTSLITTLLTQDVHSESLMAFIFFDHSYLVLASLVFFAIQTESNKKSLVVNKFQFLIISCLFLTISIIATNKGFVLSWALLSFIIPISYLMRDKRNLVYFPSNLFIAFLVPLSVGVFFYSHFARMYRFTGDSEYVADILTIVDAGGIDMLIVTFHNILYRLTVDFDRYVLIYSTFIEGEYSANYAYEYLNYLSKNFLNLILPGTPFRESYAPSSNLLGQVLLKSPLDNDFTLPELLRSLNTQPHTLPGVFIILTGIFSPLVLFLTTTLLAGMYSFFKLVYMRIGLLYLFSALLHSYGLENVIATSIHFALSLFIIMCLINFLSRITIYGAPSSINKTVNS